MLETLLLPFLIACVATPLVLIIGYYGVTPIAMTQGYRMGMPSDRFAAVDGSEGAGSVDLRYYTLYFDVRAKDVVLTGQAPKARHWQIGAFDGMARLIDGAYVNHKTVRLDEDGRFAITVTSRPKAAMKGDILDCSSTKRGMIILRVVLPEEDIVLPTVSRG
jgi:hypothetical protein